MKYLLIFTLLIVSPSGLLFAQNDRAAALIQEGVELHDKRDYEGALKTYEEVLKIDKDNRDAIYEASVTCLSLKQYDKCVSYCDRLIGLKNNDAYAYLNKGTALDGMGKRDEAINIYKEGIKKQPGKYLLHYNLAITYLNADDLDNAEKKSLDALNINPEHSSSNLILATINRVKEQKTRAMLGYYYFLMLEPRSSRAQVALTQLVKLMNLGVQQESNKKINISMSSDRDTADVFYSTDLFCTLNAAVMFTEEYENKSDFEKFFSYTESVSKFLEETFEHKRVDDFYVKLYVTFLTELNKKKLMKTYCRVISQTGITESAEWMKSNDKEIKRLNDWFDSYTSDNPNRKSKPIQFNSK